MKHPVLSIYNHYEYQLRKTKIQSHYTFKVLANDVYV